MYGFTLNTSFISKEKLWDEVENTEIHLINEPGMELLLSVHVFPYDHNILSVWIFLGALFNDDEY